MYLSLRGIVPRCCRGSCESLTQRSSGLPCLARKLTFSSRLIVAFIGSFAMHLRATFASAIRSAAHFRYDNLDRVEAHSERSDPLFRIPHSEFRIKKTPFGRMIIRYRSNDNSLRSYCSRLRRPQLHTPLSTLLSRGAQRPFILH